MKKRKLFVLALVLAAAVAALAAGLASAAEVPKAGTVLKINEATTTKVKGQLVLSATLTTADGKPLSNRRVDFYQRVEMLGARDALLGSATTDSTGTASLAYQPAQAGKQTIKVLFAGAEGYAAAEASSQVEVTQVGTLYPEEPMPFGLIGAWLPYALGAAVLAVWIVLLSVLLNTALGIRGAASAAEPSRQPSVSTLTTSTQRYGGAG